MVFGWLLFAVGAVTALASFAIKTTIGTRAPLSGGYGITVASEISNMGLMQLQMIVLAAGLALLVAGAVLAAAGAIVAEMRRSRQP